MTTINGVDFRQVSRDALAAARAVVDDRDTWASLKDILANIGDGLTRDVRLIARRKASGEFNEDDARVFIEDQKMIARIRIRSVAIVGLQLAEDIWNAMAEVFRTAIHKALDWRIL
ncbi:MAG: hypothetical protein KDH20_08535 [Rhodocyclaceae bacterium]|nr:hypothetical protein [Rhodocyclaceae bacterium]